MRDSGSRSMDLTQREYAQGDRAPGLLFVVSGRLKVGTLEQVGAGGHCCPESVVGLVQQFSSGSGSDGAPRVSVRVLSRLAMWLACTHVSIPDTPLQAGGLLE